MKFVSTVHRIQLSRGVPIATLVEKGRYEWIGYGVVGNGLRGSVGTNAEVHSQVVDFACAISREDSVKALADKGLAHASFEHLLTLGVQHPELQRHRSGVRPIIAANARLGDWSDSGPKEGGVLALSEDGDRRRCLVRVWWDKEFGPVFRFLVIPADGHQVAHATLASHEHSAQIAREAHKAQRLGFLRKFLGRRG